MSLTDLAALSTHQACGSFRNGNSSAFVADQETCLSATTIAFTLNQGGWDVGAASGQSGSYPPGGATLAGPFGFGYTSFARLACAIFPPSWAGGTPVAYEYYDPTFETPPHGYVNVLGVPCLIVPVPNSGDAEENLAAAIGGPGTGVVSSTGIFVGRPDGTLIFGGDFYIGGMCQGDSGCMHTQSQTKLNLTGMCSGDASGTTVTWNAGERFCPQMAGQTVTVTLVPASPTARAITVTFGVSSVAADTQSLEASGPLGASFAAKSFTCPVAGVNTAQVSLSFGTASPGSLGLSLRVERSPFDPNPDPVDFPLAHGDWTVVANDYGAVFYCLNPDPLALYYYNSFCYVGAPIIDGNLSSVLDYAQFACHQKNLPSVSTLGGFMAGQLMSAATWTGLGGTNTFQDTTYGQTGWSVLMGYSEGAPITDPVAGAVFDSALLMLPNTAEGESRIVGYLPCCFTSTIPGTLGRQIYQDGCVWRCVASQAEPPASLWMATGETGLPGQSESSSGACSCEVGYPPNTVAWVSGDIFQPSFVGLPMQIGPFPGLDPSVMVVITVLAVSDDGKSLTTLDTPNFSWENCPYSITAGVQSGGAPPTIPQPPLTRLPDRSGIVTGVPGDLTGKAVQLVSGSTFDSSMDGQPISIGNYDQVLQDWPMEVVATVADAWHLSIVNIGAPTTPVPYHYWAPFPTIATSKKGVVDVGAFEASDYTSLPWVSGDTFDWSMEGQPILLGGSTVLHVGVVFDSTHMSIAEADAGMEFQAQYLGAGDVTYSIGGSGSVLVTVPNFVGMTKLDAFAAMVADGFEIPNAGLVVTAPSLTVPYGSVASQTPAAGSSTFAGGAIYLVISSGA